MFKNIKTKTIIPLAMAGSLAMNSVGCSIITDLVDTALAPLSLPIRKSNPQTQPANHPIVEKEPIRWLDNSFNVGTTSCVDLVISDPDLKNANYLEIEINRIYPPRQPTQNAFDYEKLNSVEAYADNVITNKDVYRYGDDILLRRAVCIHPFGLAEEGYYTIHYNIKYTKEGAYKRFVNRISVAR